MYNTTTTTARPRRYNGYDETLDKTLSYLNTTLPTLCDVVCTLLIILLSFVYITVEYVICLLRCYNTLKILFILCVASKVKTEGVFFSNRR